ncbi:DUF5690 family protein [Pedobacter lusitanus]|uniref:DUF5690 family protein n=1 Tax=Pedobacter lusitanus TaxID=1503925 RepID=UPI000697D4D0|nr:DUF5690 family protein [Pedobacter lusitanus]
MKNRKFNRIFAHPLWALVAAFGTYFCMYGFRKPYTAATYQGFSFFDLDFKSLLIISQTLGYVMAKWVGIKFVSEIKPAYRIRAILILIGFAECMLLLFGSVPAPWNVIFLFLNGLPLGVIFGLVLGFVEGRKHTEFLVAGLCASFIVSDGVSKSIGTFLLDHGLNELWMPFFAGLIFLVPTLLFIGMLACIPAPNQLDIQERSERPPMTGKDRWGFFNKYAPGIIGIVLVYLFTTLLRSLRADFAVEIWTGLGYHQTPELFTQSELLVSFGVLLIIGLVAFITRHKSAFYLSLFISLTGLIILIMAVYGLINGNIEAFTAMVLIGLGVYLPYVAIHAIVFERLIAITREKANVGFLMYIADSVGYTGYIILMLARYLSPDSASILSIFLKASTGMAGIGILLTVSCYFYFKYKLKNEKSTTHTPQRTGCTI